MAEQFHKRVDADVAIGELGGVGVPQCMHEGAGGALGLRPGQVEARNIRYCKAPRVIRVPSWPTNRGALGGHRLKSSTLEERARVVEGKRSARLVR